MTMTAGQMAVEMTMNCFSQLQTVSFVLSLPRTTFQLAPRPKKKLEKDEDRDEEKVESGLEEEGLER